VQSCLRKHARASATNMSHVRHSRCQGVVCGAHLTFFRIRAGSTTECDQCKVDLAHAIRKLPEAASHASGWNKNEPTQGRQLQHTRKNLVHAAAARHRLKKNHFTTKKNVEHIVILQAETVMSTTSSASASASASSASASACITRWCSCDEIASVNHSIVLSQLIDFCHSAVVALHNLFQRPP
jgi:hypothetical protein